MTNKEFDERFTQVLNTNKILNKGKKLFILWFLFCLVSGFSLLGLVIWVAMHFISKWW